MPYSNTTSGKYKLPYPTDTEQGSGASEKRKVQILENALTGIAATIGTDSCIVIAEGSYTPTFNVGNLSNVVLTIGGSCSLQCIIAGVYIATVQQFLWSSISDNSVTYLYAQLIESGIYEATQQSSRQDKIAVAIQNTSGITPAESILLAKVTTTGSEISIDTEATATDNGTFITGKPFILTQTVVKRSAGGMLWSLEVSDDGETLWTRV